MFVLENQCGERLQQENQVAIRDTSWRGRGRGKYMIIIEYPLTQTLNIRGLTDGSLN
jgi:hypothetical protein